MKRFILLLSKKTVLYGIAGAVVFLGGYIILSNGNGEKVETQVVQAGDFLQQVSVSGKVVAAQDVDLGFSQSGRVAHVYGKVGDSVYAGALLAEIENGDLYATVLQRQAALENQQAKLKSLQNGSRPEDVAVAQASVDGALVALDQASLSVVNAIGDAYAKSDDVVNNTVEQMISNPRNANQQLLFVTTASQLAINIPTDRQALETILPAWHSQILSLTASSDVVAAATQAQKNLAAVSKLLSDTSSALSQSVSSQAVSQTTLDTFVADIATARTTINTTITTLNTAVTSFKSAASSLDAARKNLTLKQAGSVQTDIDAQAASVKSAQADLQNAQAQLAKTRIVAPFSGVITKMDAKIGGIASPNTPEISMIGKGAFQVETYVPEINIALIKVGDSASVTLDAYGDVPFDAKVVSIDPAETIRSGVSTYRAVLEFASQDSRIKSGMSASVVVTTARKSNVISVPQGVVLLKDGKKYVSVTEGKDIVSKEVTTGDISSLGYIEILSGLVEGDVVVLTSATQ